MPRRGRKIQRTLPQPPQITRPDQQQTPEQWREIHAIQTSSQYSGPIPPYKELQGYEHISPGFGDRILKMGEEVLAHELYRGEWEHVA